MDTYYLKKFRKKAHAKFKICKYEEEEYDVTYRNSYTVLNTFCTLELAIEYLYKKRNIYIY